MIPLTSRTAVSFTIISLLSTTAAIAEQPSFAQHSAVYYCRQARPWARKSILVQPFASRIKVESADDGLFCMQTSPNSADSHLLRIRIPAVRVPPPSTSFKFDALPPVMRFQHVPVA